MSIYLQLLLASLFWGTNVIVMKLLLNDVPFLFIATIRVFLSLLCLFIYMLYRHISFECIHKKKILLIAFMGIYLNFFFTFLGMNEVKGIDNAFINALSPIIAYIFSFIILKRKSHIYELIAIGLSLFAFLLSIHFQLNSIRIGFFYLFLGIIFYILSNTLLQKWQIGHSYTFVFYELLYGFMFLLVHCFIIRQFHISYFQDISLVYWFLFIFVSGIGFAYIQFIYMKAIDMIGTLKTSFFLSLNPLITYIESLLFLNESFDILHFIAFGLIVFSLYMITDKQ
jgi:drug/metabolite transporter (DMT)-like permease